MDDGYHSDDERDERIEEFLTKLAGDEGRAVIASERLANREQETRFIKQADAIDRARASIGEPPLSGAELAQLIEGGTDTLQRRVVPRPIKKKPGATILDSFMEARYRERYAGAAESSPTLAAENQQLLVEIERLKAELAGAQQETVVQPAAVVPEGHQAVIADDAHKPNWNLWRRKHKVTLHDAVCLSCGTSPGAVPKNLGEMLAVGLLPQFSASKDVRSEIADRHEISRSHTGPGGTLSTVTGDQDGEVNLAVFARWAIDTMKWPVPDELREMAGNDTASQSVAVPEMTHVPISESEITKVVISAPTFSAAAALKIGANSKEAMNAHIETRARVMYAENSVLNKGGIAKAIAGELQTAGYMGERGNYLSAATIEKAIPTGLTGGRAANGKNRKK